MRVVITKHPFFQQISTRIDSHMQNTDQYSNNQCENSHLHFRRRERGMNKFRSQKSLQKFTSIHANFLNHFNHQRHLETRHNYKNLRQASLESWNNIYVS
jgi:putative transposase